MTGSPWAGPTGHVCPLWRKDGACDLHPTTLAPQACPRVQLRWDTGCCGQGLPNPSWTTQQDQLLAHSMISNPVGSVVMEKWIQGQNILHHLLAALPGLLALLEPCCTASALLLPCITHVCASHNPGLVLHPGSSSSISRAPVPHERNGRHRPHKTRD